MFGSFGSGLALQSCPAEFESRRKSSRGCKAVTFMRRFFREIDVASHGYSVSGNELGNHSKVLRKKELPRGRPVICYTATHLSSRRLNLPMLARQIVLAIAQGNMPGIDNIHGRIKTLLHQSSRRNAKDAILTRENGYELRAYLQLLSAARRCQRQLDRTPVDPLRTGTKSDAAGSLATPRITEQALIWTIQYRRVTDRNGLRYPSDLTDAEWQLIQGLIPPINVRGRKRKMNMRETLNGIFYVLSTGCKWNSLPKDLPLKSAVLRYFHRWSQDGTLAHIRRKLYG